MRANLPSYWSRSLVLTLSLVYLLVTLSLVTLSLVTLSLVTLTLVTLSLVTLSLVTLSLVTLSRLFLLCHVSGVVGTGTLAQYWSPFPLPDDQDILKWKFKEYFSTRFIVSSSKCNLTLKEIY